MLYKAVVGTARLFAVYENVAYSVEHFAREDNRFGTQLLFCKGKDFYIFPILFADKLRVLFVETDKRVGNYFVVD